MVDPHDSEPMAPVAAGNSVAANQPSSFPVGQRIARAAWGVAWTLLFRPTPRPCHGWRRLLLRIFGARVGHGAKVYPSARVWAPWNLRLDPFAVVGDRVDCYNVAPVRIGEQATVSQCSYLCTATHDVGDPGFALVTAPITIEDQAWVAADVFVGPGVTVGQGTVVGARSSVFSDLPRWKICVGTPARPVRDRRVRADDS